MPAASSGRLAWEPVRALTRGTRRLALIAPAACHPEARSTWQDCCVRRVGVVDRRAAVEHYLSLERLKGTPEPPGRDQLDFDDPNELNAWLTEGGYKVGVISGFLRWAFVELAPDEIRACAVVAGITGNDTPQNLGELERGEFLVGWQPKNPGHYWDGFVGAGRSIPQEWAVILRPGMPSPATETRDGTSRMEAVA
jgi:hypothetical protein